MRTQCVLRTLLASFAYWKVVFKLLHDSMITEFFKTWNGKFWEKNVLQWLNRLFKMNFGSIANTDELNLSWSLIFKNWFFVSSYLSEKNIISLKTKKQFHDHKPLVTNTFTTYWSIDTFSKLSKPRSITNVILVETEYNCIVLSFCDKEI